LIYLRAMSLRKWGTGSYSSRATASARPSTGLDTQIIRSTNPPKECLRKNASERMLDKPRRGTMLTGIHCGVVLSFKHIGGQSMLINKRLGLVGTIGLLGTALFAMGQIPNNLQPQRCGDLHKIWTNASPTLKSVRAFFQANCNEPNENGEVTVYDGAGSVVLSLKIPKDHPQTLTFDVPRNGYIRYICNPVHDDQDDKCASQILKVSDPS
jgi:hypothetical protein